MPLMMVYTTGKRRGSDVLVLSTVDEELPAAANSNRRSDKRRML